MSDANVHHGACFNQSKPRRHKVCTMLMGYLIYAPADHAKAMTEEDGRHGKFERVVELNQISAARPV